MAFTNRANQAQREWQDYLNRMQMQENLSPFGTGKPSIPGAPALQQATAADYEQRALDAQRHQQRGQPARTYQESGSNVRATDPEGADRQATSSAAASNPAGPIGKNQYIRPGQYYSDYPETGVMKLSQDPARAVDEWAKFYGMGPAYGRYMNSIIDPMSALRIMGYDAGNLSQNGTPRLDAFSSLWRRMSGDATFGGGNNLYTNPRGMLSNVLNAQYNPGDDAMSLGHVLNAPTLLPEEQVQNTIGLILSGLQGFVSDEALNAYSSMLNQAAMDYLSYRDKNPKSWDSNQTFNRFLANRYGSGGGLF